MGHSARFTVPAVLALLIPCAAASSPEHPLAPAMIEHSRSTLPVVRVPVVARGLANVAELARESARRPFPVRATDPMENDQAARWPARLEGPAGLPSPAPTVSFPGLDDIPMLDSGRVVVPPDVNGAVGPTRIFQNLKNNVRILDKSTGALISTVGINSFWAAAGAAPNRYSDPRSVFDPYHGRFVTIMLADLGLTLSNSICLAISDTDDPGGTWHLYRIPVYMNPTYQGADFPTLGFNRNWITIAFNAYSLPPLIVRRSVFMVHYPMLRDQNTAVVYRVNDPTPDLICAAPCMTYSATCDTEYVVQRRGTSSYSLDLIHGEGPGPPTYVIGTTLTRPGGEWNALSELANTLPQSAPEAGVSSCGFPPCAIERSDDHVRAPAVYRGGSVWFAQQVGLPATNPEYVAVQWTQITTPGGGYVVGGRLQDTLATFTNGRPHYSFPSIAVNENDDFLLGFSRFSSSWHPAAGYAVHLEADGPGTLREPVIFKDGEDYYRRVTSVQPTRNRWGDFSTSQVDPVDGRTLWTAQQYSRPRVGTNDSDTLTTNSSRWGTWWAGVDPEATIDAPPPAGPRPSTFALLSVKPNPGSGSCLIRYWVPRPARVRLTLLDLQGRELEILVNEPLGVGEHEVSWDGNTAAGRARPGVYFAHMETPDGIFVQRVVVFR